MKSRQQGIDLDSAQVARVFSIDHAYREKQRLFAGETASDVERERRRSHRLLDNLTWYELGAILLDGALLIFAALGMATFVGLVLDAVRKGVL